MKTRFADVLRNIIEFHEDHEAQEWSLLLIERHGIDRQTIARLMSGEQDPDREICDRIDAALPLFGDQIAHLYMSAGIWPPKAQDSTAVLHAAIRFAWDQLDIPV